MSERAIDKNALSVYLQSAKGNVVLGIDGIIDEVWQMVDVRSSADSFTTVKHMKSFGDMISDRGSGGLAKEIVRSRRVCGGFTANTGRAVGSLDVDTSMLGMYGTERVDPVYDEFQGKCELISLGDPALCYVLEFQDGKVMFPYLENLLKFDNARFEAALDGKVRDMMERADVLGIGYWSNMPDFDNIMLTLADKVFSRVKPKRLFFDFANLNKKSVESLKKTLDVLRGVNEKIPITLSLNEHEGLLLCGCYNISGSAGPEGILQSLKSLRDKIGLDEIIIHTPMLAAISSEAEGCLYVTQDFVDSPVKTAGAGDSFNGGYIVSCLGGLPAPERIAMANAVTNYYLKNGTPPNRAELKQSLIKSCAKSVTLG